MALTEKQLHEHAGAIILDHARDVENLSISEHLEDLEMSDDDHDAATRAIDELIKKATITISWPDDLAVVQSAPIDLETDVFFTEDQMIIGRSSDRPISSC